MPETPSRSLGPTGWAVYLGCSWTWCIGMFLPALLIRDLGFWGYVVFAVPNVVGAAAMGWVLKSPESSRRLIEDHRQAAVLFSRVTQMFHVYWLMWIGMWTVNTLNISWYLFAVFAAFLIGLFSFRGLLRSHRTSQRVALLVWLISAGLLITLAFNDRLEPSANTTLNRIPFTYDALWLLPASMFGFLFCPYLDLTFHRARLECERPNASRVAFGMGFGVFFFSMILLTVLYSGPIVALTSPDTDLIASIAPWIGAYIAIHFLLQLWFTDSVHETELNFYRHKDSNTLYRVDFWLIPIFVLGYINMNHKLDAAFGLSWGELGYRAFLTFYGLIFPTYVYLNIWNVRGRCLRTRTQRSTLVTVIAIVLASPLFFMGFFVRDERYIPAGVAILLAAKLFTGSEDRPRPLAQPA